MDFEYEAKGKRVAFSRNSVTGELKIDVDGETIFTLSSTDLSTHFNRSLTIEYAFNAGDVTCHIEHSRPRWFGGLRKQTYRVFVENELVITRYGY